MDRGNAVARFAYEVPSLIRIGGRWFCSGRTSSRTSLPWPGALLEIGGGSEAVSLDELAVPYASRVAQHLRAHDKQGTPKQSRFLDVCRAHNRGELDDEGLRATTVQIGFNNLIDAFHVVDRAEVPERFFIDERRSGSGIRLTDGLRQLFDEGH